MALWELATRINMLMENPFGSFNNLIKRRYMKSRLEISTPWLLPVAAIAWIRSMISVWVEKSAMVVQIFTLGASIFMANVMGCQVKRLCWLQKLSHSSRRITTKSAKSQQEGRAQSPSLLRIKYTNGALSAATACNLRNCSICRWNAFKLRLVLNSICFFWKMEVSICQVLSLKREQMFSTLLMHW